MKHCLSSYSVSRLISIVCFFAVSVPTSSVLLSQKRPCESWAKRGFTIYYSYWTAIHVVKPTVLDMIDVARLNCQEIAHEAHPNSYHVSRINSLVNLSPSIDTSTSLVGTPRIVVLHRTKLRTDTLVFYNNPVGMSLNGKHYQLDRDLLRSFLIFIPYDYAKIVFDKLELKP